MMITRLKAAPQSGRDLICVDDSLPLDLGFLEIDEQTLQASRAEGVGHLQDTSEHPPGHGLEVSAFICVPQWPFIMKCRSAPRLSIVIIGR
jgi:hypothetical protein